MHIQCKDFISYGKNNLPQYFKNVKVLDVGFGDINGNNNYLFEDCLYEGNDLIKTDNVTIVSRTKDLPFEDDSFDTIISTECFEHDSEYHESFRKILKLLKPNGLFIFTCASLGRPEHGTSRTTPNDSYGTIASINDFKDYYKNLTIDDINESIDLNNNFQYWRSYYNTLSYDLYFIGIKKGSEINISIKDYTTDIHHEIVKTDIKYRRFKTVSSIFEKYNTDKGPYFHDYGRQYEHMFENYRDKQIKYLEIGVYNGGSLLAMNETFHNNKLIVGVDINPECKKYEDPSKNIFVEIGDGTDYNFIKMINKKYGPFDIILDDGSHNNKDVIKTFERFFPLLNDNSLYIVEDTEVYNYNLFLSNDYPNHLNYFVNFIPFLNQCRFNSNYGVKDWASDPFKILKKTANVFEYSIDKIEFGCSYIGIYKKIRYHWI
jgi:SAM-dependent methyltransferase